jgi:hypothetical protein
MPVIALQEGELECELKLPPDKRINMRKARCERYETSPRVQSDFSVKISLSLDKICSAYEKRFDEICDQSRQSLESAFQELKKHGKQPVTLHRHNLSNNFKIVRGKRDSVLLKRLEVLENKVLGSADEGNVLPDEESFEECASKLEMFIGSNTRIQNVVQPPGFVSCCATKPETFFGSNTEVQNVVEKSGFLMSDNKDRELQNRAEAANTSSLLSLDQQPPLSCKNTSNIDQCKQIMVLMVNVQQTCKNVP